MLHEVLAAYLKKVEQTILLRTRKMPYGQR